MRKEGNRAALKAFRERKEQRLKDLEAKVEDREKASEASEHENKSLRTHVEHLNSELQDHKDPASKDIGGAFHNAPPSIQPSRHHDDGGSDKNSSSSLALSDDAALSLMPWGSFADNVTDRLEIDQLAEHGTLISDLNLSIDALYPPSITPLQSLKPFQTQIFSDDSSADPDWHWFSIGLPDTTLPFQNLPNRSTNARWKAQWLEEEAQISGNPSKGTVLSAACQRCRLDNTTCDRISPQCGPCRKKGMLCACAEGVWSNPPHSWGGLLTCVQRWSRRQRRFDKTY